MMEDLARMIQKNPALLECLKKKKTEDCSQEFLDRFNELTALFGDIAWDEARFVQDPSELIELLLEMAESGPSARHVAGVRREELEKRFLKKFEGDQKDFAQEMLDVARASYRLRDDDNIYLGKIEGQMLAAVEEGRSRLAGRLDFGGKDLSAEDVFGLLRGIDPVQVPRKKTPRESREGAFQVRARQIVGQPAGRGIATGKARVVSGHSDLFQFKRGEILVCDSIDPGMTFVIPLASAVVERRGGMLIHGAIIAREYGIPCVTGAPDAARWIKTGDTLTVDGYLGIVILGEA
jgi:pyruvate,water dikinase